MEKIIQSLRVENSTNEIKQSSCLWDHVVTDSWLNFTPNLKHSLGTRLSAVSEVKFCVMFTSVYFQVGVMLRVNIKLFYNIRIITSDFIKHYNLSIVLYTHMCLKQYTMCLIICIQLENRNIYLLIIGHISIQLYLDTYHNYNFLS